MLWLTLACVHHAPPPAAVPEVVAEPGMAAFTAHYEGSQMGLGLNCVVGEEPPHGAWTAILRVEDAGATGFNAGKLLCVIVHSPSMYRREAVDEAGMMRCTGVVGVVPPRFSCESGHPPSPAMPIFDQAAWDAMDVSEEVGGDPAPAGSAVGLPEAAAQLDRDLLAMKRCDSARQEVILPAELVDRLAACPTP